MLVIIAQFLLLLFLLYSQHIYIAEVLEGVGYSIEKKKVGKAYLLKSSLDPKQLFFLDLMRSKEQKGTLVKQCLIGNAVILTIGPLYAVVIAVLLSIVGLDSGYTMLGLGAPYVVLMIYDIILSLMFKKHKS